MYSPKQIENVLKFQLLTEIVRLGVKITVVTTYVYLNSDSYETAERIGFVDSARIDDRYTDRVAYRAVRRSSALADHCDVVRFHESRGGKVTI